MPLAPVWPFSIGDYMQDTVTLSAEEHGAYLLLLMAQWSNGGEPLPNDPCVLARICRMPRRRWTQKVSCSVLRFFCETESGITHPRIAEDFRRVARKIDANRANAARGGRAKALKVREPAQAGSRATIGTRSAAEIVPIHGAYGIPLPLDKDEARCAAKIAKRIEAEIAVRWPDDPTPRDTRMLVEDAADFAREGATVEIFDGVMARGWTRMTRPPSRLSSYRSDMIATVRQWISYKRWVAADCKGTDPWRSSWGTPPDANALAHFVIPAAYRKPDEAIAVTRIRPTQQEG